MDKRDRSYVQTAADLERKYDLGSLKEASKTLKEQKKQLENLNRELNDTVKVLITNLKDYMGTQDVVSLWFFNKTPSLDFLITEDGNVIITENDDLIITEESADAEEGDLSYDNSAGKAYQYKNNEWIESKDVDLIQALALTNSQIGDSYERKVYLKQPIPPYRSGDWWLMEDGTLRICQIGKNIGVFEDVDFILASKYTTTVAIQDGNRTTVLEGSVQVLDEAVKVIEGTIVEINKNFVKFTDLSTGGSTKIAGENITTGNVKSSNYVKNISGTNLNLNTGEIETPNVIVNDDGITLKNGAKVIGENGLMNTYIFESNNTFSLCGYEGDDPTGWNNTVVNKKGIKLLFDIPKDLVITSAKVILFHAPTKWSWTNLSGMEERHWGYCRNLKLYKASNILNREYSSYYASEFLENNTTEYSEIGEAFGSNGFTATAPNDATHNTETATSIDIKTNLNAGLNELIIQSNDESVNNWSGSDISARTAFLYAIIKIDGYMSY